MELFIYERINLTGFTRMLVSLM